MNEGLVLTISAWVVVATTVAWTLGCVLWLFSTWGDEKTSGVETFVALLCVAMGLVSSGQSYRAVSKVPPIEQGQIHIQDRVILLDNGAMCVLRETGEVKGCLNPEKVQKIEDIINN